MTNTFHLFVDPKGPCGGRGTEPNEAPCLISYKTPVWSTGGVKVIDGNEVPIKTNFTRGGGWAALVASGGGNDGISNPFPAGFGPCQFRRKPPNVVTEGGLRIGMETWLIVAGTDGCFVPIKPVFPIEWPPKLTNSGGATSVMKSSSGSDGSFTPSTPVTGTLDRGGATAVRAPQSSSGSDGSFTPRTAVTGTLDKGGATAVRAPQLSSGSDGSFKPPTPVTGTLDKGGATAVRAPQSSSGSDGSFKPPTPVTRTPDKGGATAVRAPQSSSGSDGSFTPPTPVTRTPDKGGATAVRSPQSSSGSDGSFTPRTPATRTPDRGGATAVRSSSGFDTVKSNSAMDRLSGDGGSGMAPRGPAGANRPGRSGGAVSKPMSSSGFDTVKAGGTFVPRASSSGGAASAPAGNFIQRYRLPAPAPTFDPRTTPK